MNINNQNSNINTNSELQKIKTDINLDNINLDNTNLNVNKKKKIIIEFLKKILILLNLEGNIIKIFCLDKVAIQFLLLIKKLLSKNIPTLNKYIFKEKKSSMTITYTYFTTNYYSQNYNTSESNVYNSIVSDVYSRVIPGCKFSINPNRYFMFFEQFDEIQITKNIWLTSKLTPSNTSTVYILELLSYTSSVEKINKYIKYCLLKYKKKNNNNTGIINSQIKYYKYIGKSTPQFQPMFDEYPFYQTKTFDNIFFVEKQNLIKKIKSFISGEDSYKKLGIPWRMGILCYGPPGTGKTSFIKAVASLTNRNLVDISLAKIKNSKELTDILFNTKINGNDIPIQNLLFVFDEFDFIINNFKRNLDNKQNIIQNNPNNKSNNDEDNEGITAETMLTIMDGCVEHHGGLIIATTNCLHLIDKALIRPGRFDVLLHFDNANENIIEQIIEHFASKLTTFNIKSDNKLSISQKEQIKKYSKYNEKNFFSPAKISQICLTYIDNDDYFNKVIECIKKEYIEQINL